MLAQADRELFLLINSWHSPGWDYIMTMVSGRLTWIPLYLLIIILVIKEKRREAFLLIPLIIIAVAASDLISVHLFKNVFMRLRPCHEPDLKDIIHLVTGRCGGKYGFVSSHATNSFSIALLSSMVLRKRWFTIILISWAAIVSYSRVYLGVHYPGDILGGALLGVGIALSFYYLYSLAWDFPFLKRLTNRGEE